jgi:serine/threonine protein kinase
MPIRIGQILMGRYRVEEFIASGGMGAVYRVYDQVRNVPLAMKVLHSEIADDPDMFRHFQREAALLKALEHPNIVPFYGLFQDEGYVFLLEAFIDGLTLKEILQQRRPQPLTISEALTILRPICAGLGYAHSQSPKKIIHCDIKPGNIMVDASGTVYLMDFGIARYADSTITTFATAGTPAYMAPEQILGQSASPETDLYGLGAVLYELVTAQRPFQKFEKSDGSGISGSAAERIRGAQLHEQPSNPSQLNPGLPPELSRVLLKALSKDPHYRYSSTAEFLQAVCFAVSMAPNQIPERLLKPGEKSPFPIPSSPTPLSPIPPAQLKKASEPRISLPVVFFAFVGFIVVSFFIYVLIPNEKDGVKDPSVTPRPSATLLAGLRPTLPVSASPTAPPPIITTAPLNTPLVRVSPSPWGYASPVPAAYFPLGSGCGSSHLKVGDSAFLAKQASGLSVLGTASVNSTEVVDQLKTGDVVIIQDGPVCSNGQVMWNVQTPANKSGWVSEGDSQSYQLLWIRTSTPCANALPSRLKAGDWAYTIPEPAVTTRVRSEPGIDFPIVTEVDPGTKMKIISGPNCANQYVWWRVEVDGISGWMTEGIDYYFLAPLPYG